MSKTDSLVSLGAAAAAAAVSLYFEPLVRLMPSAAKADSSGQPPRTGRMFRTPIRSLIATGVTVTGDVYSSGKGLRIDGVVNGNVECGNTLLVVANTATVNGNVRAQYLILAGTVNGDIEATELVEVRPSGRVNGNIVSPSVEVYQGAKIDGSLTTSTSEVDLARLRRIQFWARGDAQLLPELKLKA